MCSKNCMWFLVCPMKRFYEEGKLDKKWIERYCKGEWNNCRRYQMEKNGEPHSDYMLPDGTNMKIRPIKRSIEHENWL